MSQVESIFDDNETSDRYWTICPYCGKKHQDSWEDNNDQDPNERDCGECGKTFIQWANVSVTYHAKRKP